MSHRLHTLQITILAALLMLGIFVALFALEGQLHGKATTATTAYIVESRPLNCTFTVEPGYNVISMPCLPTAVAILNVTNGSNVTAIYQYVPTGNDRWKVYNPNLPSYVVSDLQLLTRRVGYIVIANESLNITYLGLKAASTDVPLVPGWNLVGYPTNATRNLSTSFGALLANITRVEAYNKSGENYIYYPGGGLNTTTPGLGYWVNSTASTTWTVS